MGIEIAKLKSRPGRKTTPWAERRASYAANQTDWESIEPTQWYESLNTNAVKELAGNMLLTAALDLGFTFPTGIGGGKPGRVPKPGLNTSKRANRVNNAKFEALTGVSAWLASRSEQVLSFNWCCAALGINDKTLRRAFGQQLNVALPLDC